MKKVKSKRKQHIHKWEIVDDSCGNCGYYRECCFEELKNGEKCYAERLCSPSGKCIKDN